ncbi:hypothetical protein GCM10027051_19040 [Niabella terrae]
MRYFTILLFAIVGLAGLSSCEKEGVLAHASSPESGGNLTAAPLSTVVLQLADKAEKVTAFSWEAVDYGVPTAVSYTLEYDLAGNDFANAREVALTNNLSMDVTQAMLNAYAVQSGVTAGQSASVEFRVRTSIGGTTPALVKYSNALTLDYTTYDEIVFWYVPGDYQGWNPAAAPRLGSTDLENYAGYVYAIPSGYPKFKITANPDWNLAYGDGGNGTLSTSGGDIEWPAPMPASPGVFYITAVKSTLAYAIKPVKFMIAGDFNGWNNSTDELTYSLDNIYTFSTDFAAGGFKIVIDGNWSGGDGAGNLVIGGGENVPITAGTHTVKVDMSNPPRYKVTVE